MEMQSVLDQADSALADLVTWTVPTGALARKNPTLVGEIHLLGERLLSRLGVLTEVLSPGAQPQVQVAWDLCEAWYSPVTGEGLALTHGGVLLRRPAVSGPWSLLRSGATIRDLNGIREAEKVKRWRLTLRVTTLPEAA